MSKVLCPLAFLMMAAAPARAGEMKPGLVGEYFDRLFALADFPTISDTEKADVKRVDAQIDWPLTNGGFAGTQIVDYCYARWSGKIIVPRDGKYTLFLNSDDGSRAFVDGVQIVDNSGTHATQEKSGEVELKAGAHDLKVEFIENENGAECHLSWQGPQIEKQIVPATAFSHDVDAEK